jgi:hypothetical protein
MQECNELHGVAMAQSVCHANTLTVSICSSLGCSVYGLRRISAADQLRAGAELERTRLVDGHHVTLPCI